MTQLKPCPFCGSEAAFGTVRYGAYDVREMELEQNTYHFCNCTRCGVSNQSLLGYAAPDNAATAWNTRANVDQTAESEEVVRLQKYCGAAHRDLEAMYSLLSDEKNAPFLRRTLAGLKETSEFMALASEGKEDVSAWGREINDRDDKIDVLTAANQQLVTALHEIRELNMTAFKDENGHRWAKSDLIEQTIVAALADTKGEG